jgi:hypothetical protein
MDAGQYCLVCNGQCQQDEPIQITWGNSPNDLKLYWTPQHEKLSIALSLHFPAIDDPSVQKRAVLNMFKLSPLSNRSATSYFSFMSSQDNVSSSRTSAGSIRSLQSTSLSNTPTGNNSCQSHRVENQGITHVQHIDKTREEYKTHIICILQLLIWHSVILTSAWTVPTERTQTIHYLRPQALQLRNR